MALINADDANLDAGQDNTKTNDGAGDNQQDKGNTDNTDNTAKPQDNTNQDSTKGNEGIIKPEAWKEAIREDLRNNEKIKRIDSIEQLAEQYLESQKMISQSVRIPGTDASPEDVRKFYTKLGTPEAKEEYKFEVPEEVKELKIADGATDIFAEAAFKANLTKEQANTVYNEYLKSQGMQLANQVEAIKIKEANTVAELKRAWGSGYQDNLDNISKNIGRIFDKDTIEVLQTQTTLLSDTSFLKKMHDLTKMMTGDTLFVEGKQVTNVNQSLAEIEEERDRLLSEDRKNGVAKNQNRIMELNKRIVMLREAQNKRMN